MIDRELRLREKIDRLSDERDEAHAEAEQLRVVAGEAIQRALAAERRPASNDTTDEVLADTRRRLGDLHASRDELRRELANTRRALTEARESRETWRKRATAAEEMLLQIHRNRRKKQRSLLMEIAEAADAHGLALVSRPVPGSERRSP